MTGKVIHTSDAVISKRKLMQARYVKIVPSKKYNLLRASLKTIVFSSFGGELKGRSNKKTSF